ncbi:probable WRKY transcription factor 75 [Olea europaea subsp. europaea]|uniref:Probable WRKY transcription factor 75 n=1 Tax=Olea europaea subsp. europaea TaxID=158383 RepID=A0A8S0TDY7_OLEEU|nr:probable WRKY transcription factor 75 [Olea europaea subsp. europaea]
MESHPTLFLDSSTTVAAAPFSSNMTNSDHALNGGFYNSNVPDRYMGLKREINFPIAHVNDRKSIVPMENDVKSGKKKCDEKKTRKPRIAFRTRSKVDILDDGYRWRKYGQKAVKNQKFPRSYYRCTHQGCNVKKQVQRESMEESIVVTTYEGMHVHPVEKLSDNFEQILNQMQIYPAI